MDGLRKTEKIYDSTKPPETKRLLSKLLFKLSASLNRFIELFSFSRVSPTVQDGTGKSGKFSFKSFFKVWFFIVTHKVPQIIVFVVIFFLLDHIVAFIAIQKTKPKEGYFVCPDKFAVLLDSKHYVRCEDYDQFHNQLDKGIERRDLLLIPLPPKKDGSK